MGQYPCAQEDSRCCEGEKADTIRFDAEAPLQDDQVVLSASPLPIKGGSKEKGESKDSRADSKGNRADSKGANVAANEEPIFVPVPTPEENIKAEDNGLAFQEEARGPDPEELRRAQEELDEQRRVAEEADRERMAKYEQDRERREAEKREAAAQPQAEPPPAKQEEPKCQVQWKSPKGEMKALIFRRRPLGINFERPMMGAFKVRIAGFSKQASHAQELGAQRGWLLVSVNGKEVSGLSFEKALEVLSEGCSSLPANS